MSRSRLSVKTLVRIGLLGAIAAVLMLFEFPIPFIAPGFYQMDFSEVPVIVGGLLMGPVVGVLIELVKILLNLAVNGTITAGVGEAANFIMGSALVVPMSILYRRWPTFKGLLVALVAGVVSMTLVAALVNYYVLLPLFAKAFQLPLEAFVEMGAAVNPIIVDLRGLVLLAVVPFNLLKGTVVAVISFFLYRRIGRKLEDR